MGIEESKAAADVLLQRSGRDRGIEFGGEQEVVKSLQLAYLLH